MDTTGETVGAWLGRVCAGRGDAPAVRGVDDFALSYRSLLAAVTDAGDALNAWGIGRGDVVMIALPDGPIALTAFLAVSRVATAFPVPAQEQPEQYARLLDQSKAKAIVIEDRASAPLTRLAAGRGLTLIHVLPPFRLQATRPRPAVTAAPPRNSDVAMLTLTSGTASLPRLIAATHSSLHTSLRHMVDWVGLTAEDRALCVMPMVHLHALLRSTLPVLMAGGAVIAAPGFDRAQVLGWFDRLRPTYFTAAPSLYRALLEEIAATGWNADTLRLALIGSDMVDADLRQCIARAFTCRVLQFYALTEASPFVAMTDRDASSGSAMRINPVWRVRVGDNGEIQLRGGIINRLYDEPNDHGAHDCFHTGDLGQLDAEGCLTVTGRLGDRITRGAEKIEPQSVERALLRHPAVREATAFGLPDPQLGQVVAAAVELHAPTDTETLLAAAAAHLPAHEVPERLFVVDRIPTTAGGKVSRRSLAQHFAAHGQERPRRAPDGPADVQAIILDILRRNIDNPTLTPGADFFIDGGGDSFAALNAALEIESAFATNIPPAAFRRHPSAASLAWYVAGRRNLGPALEMVPVRTTGSQLPLFITHSIDGQNSFATMLADGLEDRPVYTFHETRIAPDDLGQRNIATLAHRHVRAIRRIQPNGPYHLAGHSWGANLAFEIARQLRELGEPVAFVGLIDALPMLHDRAFDIRNRRPNRDRVEDQNFWALRASVPGPYDGAVHYFRASGHGSQHASYPAGAWDFIARGGVTCIDIEGDHFAIAETSGIGRWRGAFAAALAQSAARPANTDVSPFGPGCQAVLDAFLAARRGERAQEIALYEQALGVEPDLPFWVHANRSEALFEDGRIDAGVTAYRRAVALDPWPLTTMVRLVPALKQHRQKALRRAARVLAAKVRIDHPSVAFQKGRVLWLARRFKEAERAFQHGLRLDPDTMSILVAYGRFMTARGRAREAVALLQNAVQRRLKPSAARRHLLRELKDARHRAAQQPAPRRHWLRALLGLAHR